MSIPDLFRPKLSNTRMKFQVANGEIINAMSVTHISVQMCRYMFKLPIFACDLEDLDCIFGMDAGKITGFITCAHTGRIWFNAHEMGEPEQLSRNISNAICHLRTIIRIKLFKTTTIEVAYANLYKMVFILFIYCENICSTLMKTLSFSSNNFKSEPDIG